MLNNSQNYSWKLLKHPSQLISITWKNASLSICVFSSERVLSSFEFSSSQEQLTWQWGLSLNLSFSSLGSSFSVVVRPTEAVEFVRLCFFLLCCKFLILFLDFLLVFQCTMCKQYLFYSQSFSGFILYLALVPDYLGFISLLSTWRNLLICCFWSQEEPGLKPSIYDNSWFPVNWVF